MATAILTTDEVKKYSDEHLDAHPNTETDSSPSEDAPLTLKDFDPILAPYREASTARSIWQLTSALGLFAALNAIIFASLPYTYWGAILLIPIAGFITVRIFIFQHDCGHRSFFKSKKWNDRVGSLLGVLTLTPYEFWRRAHASHHATSGDLDRRGKSGEIFTLTVKEYKESSWFRRLYYRVYRNPFVLFGIGPFFQFAIRQRFAFELPKTWKKERLSVYWTNAGILIWVASMCWLVGPWNFLVVQLCISAIASSVGVWMFYMQHQYEDGFWEHSHDWDYVQAALDGSSYYRLPKILQWFSGNIGLHHIHHLDSRIPNYNLQECHDKNPELQEVNEFSFWESLSCANVRLYDEETGKMVGFDAVK